MESRFSRVRLGWLLCLVLVLAQPAIYARSQKDNPKIKQFRWTETDSGFHVSALLNRAFNHEVEETINAGIPTTFHYYLYLKQMRWYWDNKIISEAECWHTVTYDTLRKVYTIVCQRTGDLEPYLEVTTEDPAEMRTLMNTFQGDLKIDRNRFNDNKQYYLSLQVTLKTEKLPPPWDKILFFMSPDFKTEISRQWIPRQTPAAEK